MMRMPKGQKDQLYRTVKRTILAVEAILLAAASLVFYQYNVSQFVQQVEKSDQKILHTHMMSAEAMQQLAYKIAQQIGQDPQIAYLQYSGNFDPVQLLRSVSQLNNYRTCLPYIGSIYVYNGALDSVTISSPTEGGYDIPLRGDSDGEAAFFDQDAAKIIYGDLRSSRRFAPIVHSVTFPNGKQDVYYTFAFFSSFDNLPGKDGVLVNFSSDWLRQIASEENDSMSRTLILDGEQNVIFSSDSQDILTKITADIVPAGSLANDQANSAIQTVDGAKMLISVLSSNLSGWRYVRMTPYSQVVRGMSSSLLLMLLMDLGLFMLGIVSVTIASRRLYTPINRMSTRLDHAEKERESLIKQRQWVRELTSAPMEDGENPPEDLSEAGMILIAQIVLETGESLDQEQRDELLCAEVRLTEQMIGRANEVHGLQMDDGFSTALILKGDLAEDGGIWKRLCDAFNDFSEKRYGRPIRLSASRCNRGAFWKAQGYRQAWEAMRYHILPRFGRVVVWDEIEAIDSSGFVYPQSSERMMLDSIMNGNVKGAIERFEQIMMYSQDYSMTVIQLTISTLTITLLGVVEELRKGALLTSSVIRDALMSVPALDQVSSLDDILLYLQNIIKMICQEIENNRGNRYADLLEKVDQIIREHYREPDCSLSYVAEQVGMSSAYISRIYKQSTLRSIPDEIGAYRMELARKLLAERRDMSIEQIAVEVGFTSSSYFSKAFKKDHGMSPKEYRISGIGEEGSEGEEGGQ